VAALFGAYFLRHPARIALSSELSVTGRTMGTTFTVKVVTDDLSEANHEHLTGRVRAVVDEVDQRMSTYKSTSEVERFNHGGIEVFAVSPDLLEVVVEAQRVAQLTGGAFDVTVGPLVDAWGFGPSGATDTPGDEILRELLAITGFELIEVDVEHATLRKTLDGCRIDLSAIAKGFAVDRVSAMLAGKGLPNHMVEIGGEVRCRGVNGTGQVWRIGIERPAVEGRSVHLAVPLKDLSLATSGDYRNFVARDGVRISHTIDPRTGHPVSHDLASVSVIHASCMTADALATGLGVLGPDEGFELAERQKIAALFLVRTGDDDFEELRTSTWMMMLENSAGAGKVE
jgi:thiamine biosynthesis lipoprotein